MASGVTGSRGVGGRRGFLAELRDAVNGRTAMLVIAALGLQLAFIRVPSWMPPASAGGGNVRPRGGAGEAGPPPRRYGVSVDDHPGDGSQGWLLLCDL